MTNPYLKVFYEADEKWLTPDEKDELINKC